MKLLKIVSSLFVVILFNCAAQADQECHKFANDNTRDVVVRGSSVGTWGKRILWHTYFLECKAPLRQSQDLVGELPDLAMDLIAHLNSGYDSHSQTVRNDLVALANALDEVIEFYKRKSVSPQCNSTCAQYRVELETFVKAIRE